MKSLKTRINDLENQHPERPIKAVYQDWDNPERWHLEGPQLGAALTWNQVKAACPGHDFIKVLYSDDWMAIP